MPIICQITVSSLEHVSGRLRFLILMQLLTGASPIVTTKIKNNKKEIEPKPGTKNEYSPAFGAHLLTHTRRRGFVLRGPCVKSWSSYGAVRACSEVLL